MMKLSSLPPLASRANRPQPPLTIQPVIQSTIATIHAMMTDDLRHVPSPHNLHYYRLILVRVRPGDDDHGC